jgi:GT2 family glycosyltransferase
VASVTVGVPVFHGEAFVAEALNSIQAQTHRDLRVLISVDGPDSASEEACRPFLDDPRFELVVQPETRGWVDNLNWLMARVETDFWCYQQQDDVIDSRYVEVLLEHAAGASEAAMLYCDIRRFGRRDGLVVQTSVTGGAVARQLSLLLDHHSAVAFRGLTRAEALRHAAVPRNAADDFSADTTWMAAAARAGELRRVPAELYHKRYHPENVNTKWARWPSDRRARAWVLHCADMLEQAMAVEATASERWLLWLAAVERLGSRRTASGFLDAELLDTPGPPRSPAAGGAAGLAGLGGRSRLHPGTPPAWRTVTSLAPSPLPESAWARACLPGFVRTLWLGRAAARARTVRVALRAAGARDLGLGLGLKASLDREARVRGWLEAGLLADAVDPAATVAAGRDLPFAGRLVGALFAGSAAALGAWLVRSAELGPAPPEAADPEAARTGAATLTSA